MNINRKKIVNENPSAGLCSLHRVTCKLSNSPLVLKTSLSPPPPRNPTIPDRQTERKTPRGGVRTIPACNAVRRVFLHIIDFSLCAVIVRSAYYGGPEVQNTKQTKQNRTKITFLYHFYTILIHFYPKHETQLTILSHNFLFCDTLENTKHIWKSQNTFGNHKTHSEITKHI